MPLRPYLQSVTGNGGPQKRLRVDFGWTFGRRRNSRSGPTSLIVAWNLPPAGTRDAFRAALPVDDSTWARGRGWALSVGLIALPHYVHTNPVLAGIARHSVDEVLADHA
jgi:aminoglycoside phosphotransferase (APT) family kinase protein